MHRCVVWHFAACNRCLSTAKLCSDLLLPYWHWHRNVLPRSFGDLTAWSHMSYVKFIGSFSLPLFSSRKLKNGDTTGSSSIGLLRCRQQPSRCCYNAWLLTGLVCCCSPIGTPRGCLLKPIALESPIHRSYRLEGVAVDC